MTVQESEGRFWEENSRLREELGVAVEQVDTLTRVMEKLKLELDSKINNSLELEESKAKVEELKRQIIILSKQKQELEGKKFSLEKQIEQYKETEDKMKKLLEELKAKCELLESIRNTLANKNQELYTQLNLEAIKGQTERSKVKAEVEELLAERSNYVNQTKKFSEFIGNSQGILQQVSADLLLVLDTYREHLIPILENNIEIFGSELCRVVFPRFGVESIAEHPEYLLQWINAFKEFMIVLAKEIENTKRYIMGITLRLNKAEGTVDDLSNKLQIREDEIIKLKEVNKLLNEDKVTLNKKLKSVEESIQSYSIEALSSERKYKDDNNVLNIKMQELITQNEGLQNELKEWISTAETSNILVNALEQKIKQISDEKKDYELLLTRVHSVLPYSELQKIISEIIVLQKELHVTLREKAIKEQVMEDNNFFKSQQVTQLNIQCEKLRSQLGKVKIEY